MSRVDLYHSRRTYYKKCLFWVRDESTSVGNATKWILNNKPSGMFYAKIVSNRFNQEQQVNNVFMLDKNYVTIETNDEVSDLSRGCLVSLGGELYMVESVQSKVHLKECEFSKKEHRTYIISMRK